MSRITWKYVRESAFPAMASAARNAGLDTSQWQLSHEEVPMLILGSPGNRKCQWSTPQQCADYLNAWAAAFSEVVFQRQTNR